MHRKSRLRLRRNISTLLMVAFVFSVLRFFAKNPYVAGAYNSDYSRECAKLTCDIGEQCVNRKFWCNYTLCPTMTYCSKSRKESLKGPESCESVQCSPGFKCLVRVRDCQWNQKCKYRVARCVPDWEFYNGAPSCVDHGCPKGRHCILRESHCYRTPCKLTKSCATIRDVFIWLDKCKRLGCRSEYDCFLRRPSAKCTMPSCNHVPDCLSTNNLNEESTSDEYCHGWICPTNQVCSARTDEPCYPNDCQITRSCRGIKSSQFQQLPIDILSPATSLTDLEREIFLREQRKPHNVYESSLISNITNLIRPAKNLHDYVPGTKAKRVTATASSSTSFDDSPWLTYLRREAGAEAIRYWIEKAKNNEDYEEFTEWLDGVSNLLDPETYRLWLHEVDLATTDVPEFQSWISRWNRDSHRFTPSASVSHPSDSRSQLDDTTTRRTTTGDAVARRSFPGSIGSGRANNLFYSDRSFVYVDPDSNYTNSDYHRSFMEKQIVAPPMLDVPHPHVSSFENAGGQRHQQQQQQLNPSNFNFNEMRRFDETVPGFQRGIQSMEAVVVPSPPFPYPGIAHRRPVQDSVLSDLGRRLPASRAQEFGEAVKNSWKSWQSYYQLNPPPQLPNFLGFPTRATTQNSYYLSNYTRVAENFSIDAIPSSAIPQQPQTFFPNIQSNDFGRTAVQPNSNLLPQVSTNNLQVNLGNNNIYQEHNVHGEYEKFNGDSLPPGISTISHQIAGIEQFNQLKSSIIKLDPNQPLSHVVLPANNGTNSQFPNLLIYFPPPLNFIIYFSAKQYPNTTNNTSENYNLNKSKSDIAESLNKTNTQGEIEHIRKIIRELIEYLDEEEKSLENLKKYDKSPSESSDEKSTEPNLSKILEWLKRNSNKNSSSPDQKPQKNETLTYNGSEDYVKSDENSDNQKLSHSNTNDTTKKIRILVDLDKNPELLQVLNRGKESVNKNESGSNEYQVIVNLNDFVDPIEEDLVSRKLINIASSQLHKNFTNEQKVPKILWVFPVYEDEDNKTIIDQIDKWNKQKESANTNNNSRPTKTIHDNEQIKTDTRTVLQPNEYDDNDYIESEDSMKSDEDYDEQESYDEPQDEESNIE